MKAIYLAYYLGIVMGTIITRIYLDIREREEK